jgi:hypothetical protein
LSAEYPQDPHHSVVTHKYARKAACLLQFLRPSLRRARSDGRSVAENHCSSPNNLPHLLLAQLYFCLAHGHRIPVSACNEQQRHPKTPFFARLHTVIVSRPGQPQSFATGIFSPEQLRLGAI